MRGCVGFLACLLVVGAGPFAVAEDDPAPVGATFEGVLKRFGLPNDEGSLVGTYVTRIKIMERDGDKFVGNCWITDGDKVNGFVIEGTITQRGAVKFTATKPLPGTNAGDVLGRVSFVGAIKEGQMQAKYTIPNATNVGKLKRAIPRFGTIDLKRKTDE